MTEREFKTIAAPAQAEIVIKKSRFTGRLLPAKTPEEAAVLLADLRTQYWNASHHVWAYALRAGQQRRYSDDGEPQGTAGVPVLESLLRAEVSDCLCVVTRYFGGILLGASGLVRAYTQAATAALGAAEIRTMALSHTLRTRCDYGFYGRLVALVPECGGTVLAADFAQEVTVTFRLRAADAEDFAARLRDASHGRCTAELLEESFASR
ncbi:MAG: IMPACT family protein [Oscillospiraceae bacterium]|jgi:uncharacterized YigZ family protein|nr:IMPACT family protein [Oscillospiraceae bacterium]